MRYSELSSLTLNFKIEDTALDECNTIADAPALDPHESRCSRLSSHLGEDEHAAGLIRLDVRVNKPALRLCQAFTCPQASGCRAIAYR